MFELLSPHILFPCLISIIFGIFVGATPGLTATMAVALIVPITFYMPDPSAGLAMILGVSFTAIFAGDLPAVYLRIPGTPASAAAVVDGHALAKKGRAQLALFLDLTCSCLGGLFGVLVLMFLAPQLARFALRFSNFEYFWLAILGLSMSVVVSGGRPVRGALAALLGMLLSTVGIDMVSGTPRFTFGVSNLMEGIGFIPVMIGLFGLSEVLRGVGAFRGEAESHLGKGERARWGEVLGEVWRHKGLLLRSSTLGTIIGALPGAGADIAAWSAYGLAQRTSKKGGEFGQGSIEGVIAPTSANNAAVAGAWIPALVFGIPGDSVTAIVLGAMLMYNITPGPDIFTKQQAQVSELFHIALFVQFLLFIAGYIGIRAFGWIMRLPRAFILVAVVAFSVVGAYALQNTMFDVYVMLIAGVLGFGLDRLKVPLAPLTLGLILGPLAEQKLRAGLISAQGQLGAMFTSPICLALMLATAAILFGPSAMRRLFHKEARAAI